MLAAALTQLPEGEVTKKPRVSPKLKPPRRQPSFQNKSNRSDYQKLYQENYREEGKGYQKIPPKVQEWRREQKKKILSDSKLSPDFEKVVREVAEKMMKQKGLTISPISAQSPIQITYHFGITEALIMFSPTWFSKNDFRKLFETVTVDNKGFAFTTIKIDGLKFNTRSTPLGKQSPMNRKKELERYVRQQDFVIQDVETDPNDSHSITIDTEMKEIVRQDLSTITSNNPLAPAELHAIYAVWQCDKDIWVEIFEEEKKEMPPELLSWQHEESGFPT